MRLLNTKTLELKFFFDNEVPPYAILSHTWGTGEVSLQHLNDDIDVSDRLGYVKLRQSCELAAYLKLEYIWIDTCCIDKSSSAELSEAINSMFRWYAKSAMCIAFLPDVPSSADMNLFRQSRWFTRGWTLQELIAPQEVIFYTQDWTRLGTRASLKKDIQEVTGIPEDVFAVPLDLDSLDQLEKLKCLSVAEKMRWAAKRRTTRPEDVAYCLMGIFDINMPLLYGEGQEKAFKRLQEEIIKATDDESIYVWRSPDGTPTEIFRGLLAESPANFENNGGPDDLDNLLPKRSKYLTRRSGLSTVMTNRGIHLELPLSPLPTDESGTVYLAFLDCEMRRGLASVNPAILLQRTSWDNDAHFVRIRPDLLVLSLMNNIIHPDELLRVLAEDSTKPFKEAITRQIFIPHDTPEIRYPKGMIFHPRIRGPEEAPYRIEVCSRSPTWQLFHQESTPKFSSTESYEINFDIAPVPSVEELTEPKVLGALELYVEAVYGSQPITICLVAGLEPLPLNPLGTPALYFTPWYAFVEKAEVAKGDFTGALDKAQRKDRLQLLHTLTASFELESKYSRLFYCVTLRIDETEGYKDKRSRWF